jgi:hypothetical protein
MTAVPQYQPEIRHPSNKQRNPISRRKKWGFDRLNISGSIKQNSTPAPNG